MDKLKFIASVLVIATWTGIGAKPIVMVNGEEHEGRISNISFTGDNVIMTFAGGEKAVEDMADVEVVFDITGSLSDNVTEEYIVVSVDRILIKGLNIGTECSIININGSVVMSAVSDSDEFVMNISSLNNGVYILKAGSKSVKFLKK